MALSKSITTACGAAAAYHRVRSVTNRPVVNGATLPPQLRQSVVTVECWLSADVRNAAKADRSIVPVAVKSIPTASVLASCADAYDFLKTLSDFSGATDV